ncbi:MAG: AsmA-like C-terminal region-containing protein, partial [Ignavibacteriales bacterium]
LSGPAELTIAITRPMLFHVQPSDYGATYKGAIHNSTIRDVAIGMDLTNGEMAVEGDLKHVRANGTGRVGPFAGNIAFNAALRGRDAGTKAMALNGKVSFVGAEGAPFQARITTRNGTGGGVIRSRVFDGRIDWTPQKVLATGVGQPVAWRQSGLPVGSGLPGRVPVKLAMNARGDAWTGGLEANAYSGSLFYSHGSGRIFRYSAEITPDEARRMGVSQFPMFHRTQQLVFSAALQDVGGAADYSLASMKGRVEWTPGSSPGALNYRFHTSLDRADFADIGLPLRPDAALPVDAQGVAANGGISGQAQVAGASVRYTVSPPKAGGRRIALSGSAPEATFARVGLDIREFMDGAIDFSGNLDQASNGRLSGRLEADLSRAALAVPDSGWAKPAGRPARGYIDLAVQPGGGVTAEHIVAEGPGLEVSGSAVLTKDKLARLSLPKVRMEGFFDGSLTAREEKNSLSADVNARYLDFRPILKGVQKASGSGAAKKVSQSLRLDADIARVRISDEGYVKDVKLSGGWGAPAERRATLTASTLAGSAIKLKAFPDTDTTALSVEVADLGDIAKSLGGYANLRGGSASGTGRVVEGGYDFDFDVKNLTIIRVPGAAQLVATNGAIVFDEVIAPMKLRGSTVTLEDVRATGKSVGLTARGVMDTKTRTLDVVGVVTPAYVLNAALGGIFGARETEGLFGITYTAKGPFTDPKITINPLSVAAPGFLRRLFEPRTPTAHQE